MLTKTPLLVLALMVAALLAIPLAGATAPATNGRIAFSRFVLSSNPYYTEIWVVNPDGTGAEHVTHVRPNYMDQQPDWSPDGKRMVFARCPQEPDLPKAHCRIYTVKADGSDLTPIGPGCTGRGAGCGDDRDPAWSPDGTTIAFTREWGRRRLSEGQEQHSELFLMSADGKDVRRLTHLDRKPFSRSVRAAAWSPDGRRLVFVVHNSHGTKPVDGRALFVMGADGTGLHRLTAWRLHAGDHPDWSPDGSRILFTAVLGEDELVDLDGIRQGDIYTVRADGTRPRRLTHLGTAVKYLQSGSFSPDGRSIVFAASTGAAGSIASGVLPDVFVMSADGTNIRPVTRTKHWDGLPDWGPQ